MEITQQHHELAFPSENPIPKYFTYFTSGKTRALHKIDSLNTYKSKSSNGIQIGEYKNLNYIQQIQKLS